MNPVTTLNIGCCMAAELWSRLVTAGLSPDTPTVWVLEGFIGELLEPHNPVLTLDAIHSTCRE